MSLYDNKIKKSQFGKKTYIYLTRKNEYMTSTRSLIVFKRKLTI